MHVPSVICYAICIDFFAQESQIQEARGKQMCCTADHVCRPRGIQASGMDGLACKSRAVFGDVAKGISSFKS